MILLFCVLNVLSAFFLYKVGAAPVIVAVPAVTAAILFVMWTVSVFVESAAFYVVALMSCACFASAGHLSDSPARASTWFALSLAVGLSPVVVGARKWGH